MVAKDQQTILIGGLMSDKVINSVTKIPLLGDIPILGFFFRSTTKHIVKTNQHPATVLVSAMKAVGYTGNTLGEVTGDVPELFT